MDSALFVVISLIGISTVVVVGDVMYVGFWYYIALPAVAYLLAITIKPKPLFLTAVSFAILATYIPYFYHNLFTEHPEGLLGLGHLLSLPGLAVGIVLTGLWLKSSALNPFGIFAVGSTGVFAGFLINQFIVCNSVMYCGNLTWPFGLLSGG
ncbi:hypothetical protein [Sedimenticola thiotaurini]|uniref:Uncharacterized protein n=1 Tax=Sedimenticola thiotaurini TaxID=1543721 RepID=A0A0F7JU77_9GAMM|nr:hypothetical protein [Sedimenticola thiotaurini]AKH19182.1 hypothetical protein AAY24_01160 [Sedimenticola thiotaurini]